MYKIVKGLDGIIKRLIQMAERQEFNTNDKPKVFEMKLYA